ncbi:MAG: CocE/NonD family hydrolase [bacterium]
MQEKLYDACLFEENVMIPMRDGVRLATDIYRPFVNGVPVEEKLPIILQRTPYNKQSKDRVREANYFVQRGYIYAIQDVRGAYKSEGVFVKYMNGPEDGYDTIEWLAKLPYTNRKIGMWGFSAGAHATADATKLSPPHLQAVALNCGGLHNAWEYKILNFGILELAQQLAWAFRQAQHETDDPIVKEYLKHEKIEDWIAALPLKKGFNPLSIVPEFEDYIFDIMENTDYGDYWKKIDLNWVEYFKQTKDIPMIHITGWFDSYVSGTIKNYLGLSGQKKSPIKLLIGSWTHGDMHISYAGDVEFGTNAAIPDFYNQWHVDWFDYCLKEKQNRFAQEPDVKIFVMGTGDGHKDENGRLYHGGEWRIVEKWPLPGTKYVKYYFHIGGKLNTRMPGPDILPTTYTYDPSHPVPTIGGSFSPQKPLVVSGAFDQREKKYEGDPEKGFYGSRPPYLPLRARNDVVVFQTEPLAEDIEVIGPITVKLYASSTAVDTDFTAKLVDVYPPSADYPTGFEMNVTDGIVRARYREIPEKQVLMTPGEIYEFTIEPFPTANVFKKGHRIRIDISSSNFPRFEPNPNTGESFVNYRRKVCADNSIYHNQAYPSHVILPIVSK